MKFNTPEASSARSERLFSGGKLVLETKATVLLMRTLKKYYSLILTKSSKGQLISKRNSQAEDSPKKRTNEFVFTSMRRVFVRFLGESLARKKSF